VRIGPLFLTRPRKNYQKITEFAETVKFGEQEVCAENRAKSWLRRLAPIDWKANPAGSKEVGASGHNPFISKLLREARLEARTERIPCEWKY